MTAVSPVMPGSKEIEVVLGVGQPEYDPFPVVFVDSTERPMVSRWRLSDQERVAVVNGADIVLQQLTFNNPFQPVNLQVVMPDDNPVLVEL